MLSVDKFGRWTAAAAVEQAFSLRYNDLPAGERGTGFIVDSDDDGSTLKLPPNSRICNIADPIDADDSVTLHYLLDNTVNSIQGAFHRPIVNADDPKNENDAVTLRYVDGVFPEEITLGLGSSVGLDMKGMRITEVADPVGENDLVTARYISAALQSVRLLYQDVKAVILKDPVLLVQPKKNSPHSIDFNPHIVNVLLHNGTKMVTIEHPHDAGAKQ